NARRWMMAQAVNYDEDKVPQYTLPDPLCLEDGTPVVDARTWHEQRRQEILDLFARHVYGRTPEGEYSMRSEVIGEADDALGGRAIRKEILVSFAAGQAAAHMMILLYLPAAISRPVPLFLGLNFFGNHSIHP